MKNKTLKLVGLFLACVMLLSLFCACEKTAPEQTSPGEETKTESQTPDLTQEAPKPKAHVIDTISYRWSSSKGTFSVGQNLELDANGKIVSFSDNYSATTCRYNEDGTLSRIDEQKKSSGKTGYETWTYENGDLIANYYDANDGFRSLRDTKVQLNKDENGRVNQRIDKNTFTDVEDGKKSTSTYRYEYNYDENGRIGSFLYYSDNKLDHTTNLTYDVKGNLTVYSNVGSTAGEYLRIEITYKEVDADTITAQEIDPFVFITNFNNLISYII